MRITPKFYNRDFSERLDTPPGQYIVNSYGFAATGGPKAASLSVNATNQALWQLVDLLRCPVELCDDAQRKVWWGYVSEVRVRYGQVEIGVGIEDMANKVSVQYAKVDASTAGVGTRQTTAPPIAADSVAEYGTKELRISLSNATLDQSNALAANVLAQRRYPITEVVDSGANVEGSFSATITCAGWWDTLKWETYVNTVNEEAFTGPGNLNPVKFGLGPNTVAVAERFSLPGASDFWWASELLLGIYAEVQYPNGANNDELVYAELWSEAGGVPGALVRGSTGVLVSQVAASGTGDGYQHFTLTTPFQIVGGVNYWIVVRTDPPRSDGYWMLRYKAQNGSPYARGALSTWNGFTWSAADATTCMPFRVLGLQDTAQQVQTIIQTNGQFLNGADNELPAGLSGLQTTRFRNGDIKAHDEIIELLDSGTTSLVRILTYVGPERRVRIYQEPLPANPAFYMKPDGTFVDDRDNPIDPTQCPCGVWVGQRGIIPPDVDLPALASAFPFFVEEASYDPQQDIYRPQARVISDVWKLGGLQT